MALTDTAIQKAKAGIKDRKLAAGKGLYLLVTSKGSRLWRFKYRIDGKERKLAIGKYPDVGLKAAKAARDRARGQLEQGVDPSHAKQEARILARIATGNTFEAVAKEYILKESQQGRAKATVNKAYWLLDQLSPALGHRPVSQIAPHEILAVLKKFEVAGKHETARRLRSFAGRVFRYAVATARASLNPAEPLKDALVTPRPQHHAAITDPATFGALLRAIEAYSGHPVTRLALQFTAHVFQRPGEIRKAEWSELDLDRSVWSIPAGRMKQRRPHHVPLSRQSVSILVEAKALTGDGRYVFPCAGSAKSPLSENGIGQALRRMGYAGDVMTAHGFRTIACSLLNECGKWNPDAIERALSHRDADQVRAAYHRSAYWNERVEMAQWWSDHIIMLQKGADIVSLQSIAPPAA